MNSMPAPMPATCDGGDNDGGDQQNEDDSRTAHGVVPPGEHHTFGSTRRAMPARRFSPPWTVSRRALAYSYLTAQGWAKEANRIMVLRGVLFGVGLCLVGIDYINSANAQQTDQQTIVTK